MERFCWSARLGLLAVLFSLTTGPAIAEGDKDLAKESQNPIGNIISLPFENTTEFDVGTEDAIVNTLSLKPVYPVNVGEWNLINRAIVPIVYQEERFPGEGDEFGLGDLTLQVFASPAKPSKLIWGIGPAVILPTHTDDRLGTDALSLGPAVIALAKPGNWLVGALVQNLFSVAGDDDVNLLSFQYFVNYNFDDGWYFSSTPTLTANWEADSDERWTVPVGGGVGRLIELGKQPIDIKLQAYWNAVHPDNGADWATQLQVKFLFPK